MTDTPTRILRDQHVNILRIASILEEVLATEPEPGAFDYDAVGDCVSFIRLYADALHHGKEEDLLFPELEARGMSRQAGPIAVMLYEHEQGRAFAKAMADALEPARAGDADAQARLRHAGLGYVDLIRAHIGKEDNILFQMADQLIDAPGCRTLCQAYEGVCQRRFDGCTVAELEGILASLTQRYPDA
ncbi:MAG: hemerythrin domain-containing protein [Gemmatimonadota bacterium]|nr:hemerythrin domain-containing protein [Gemmatimonadota bacterium]